MDKKYLPDLISELDQELLRLGYTKGSMNQAVLRRYMKHREILRQICL